MIEELKKASDVQKVTQALDAFKMESKAKLV